MTPSVLPNQHGYLRIFLSKLHKILTRNRSRACCSEVIIIYHHHIIRHNFNNCPNSNYMNKYSLGKCKLMKRQRMFGAVFRVQRTLSLSSQVRVICAEKNLQGYGIARHLGLFENGFRAMNFPWLII